MARTDSNAVNTFLQRLFLSVLGSLTVPCTVVATEAVVRIEHGVLRGSAENGLEIFRGVPYAAPPVGALRWRAPQPVAEWRDIKQATRFGAECPQPVDRDESPGPYMDEDCLTLNVWAPTGVSGRPRPVMVWIHGGSFKHGAGSRPSYDGAQLARQGIVVVTINYRLGHLGIFAHPQLSRIKTGEPLGNYAIMDQIAALEWVRRNIARFGGDADTVTVFGYSAGGKSVLTLMVSPYAKGLFHRAIAQSGGGRIGEVPQHLAKTVPGNPSLESEGEGMARYFNIETSNDVVAALRDLAADDIVDYANRHGPRGTRSPVVDGNIVPAGIVRLFEQGRQHDVPMMIGANSWEGSILSARSVAAIRQSNQRLLGNQDPEQLRELYGDVDIDTIISGPWFRDWAFLTSARYLSRQMRRVSSPAYLYLFDYVAESLKPKVPGAAHGSEVGYVFETLAHPEAGVSVGAVTERDTQVAEAVSAYWVAFAKTGNPNSPGLPDWARYGLESDGLLYIGDPIETRHAYAKESLDYHERRELNVRQTTESN